MEQLEIKTEKFSNLVPTGLERNLPIIGFYKYLSRTEKSPHQDLESYSDERKRYIDEIGFRQAKISGLVGLGIVTVDLLRRAYFP